MDYLLCFSLRTISSDSVSLTVVCWIKAESLESGSKRGEFTRQLAWLYIHGLDRSSQGGHACP